MQIVSLNFLSYSISIIINLGLGFWVYIQNPKSKVNKYFFIFIIGIVGWLVSLFIFYNIDISDWILFIGRFNFAIVIIFIFSAFEFVLVFPAENFVIKKWLYYSIVIENILLFFITLFTPLVDQNEAVLGSSRITSYGNLYYFYIAHFVIFSAFIIWILVKKYALSSKEDKLRIYYVISGLLLWAIFGFSTNILIPLFGYQDIASLGPLSTLFLLLALSYSIIKHHLFNTKIIVVELLVFALWVVLFINTFLSFGSQDFPLNTIILIFIVVIGIFLIKGVIKEVEQKEKMEQMAKELERAYGVEKNARRELEKLDAAKNQFLLATQHHLRTPLTAMRGYVDLLMTGSYGKLSKKVQDPIKKFEISTNRLLRVVNELLDVSQFQLGRKVVNLQPNSDITPVIKELSEELRFEAEAKGIYFKIERPEALPLITADIEKLKVAMYNLVDNAIKYTNEGGVSIKLEVNDGELRIIISDTGMGVSKEELPTLFNRIFERTEEAQQTHSTGRGIGLYITSQIIQAHKGKVWAESEGKGKGTTFFVEIPISK